MKISNLMGLMAVVFASFLTVGCGAGSDPAQWDAEGKADSPDQDSCDDETCPEGFCVAGSCVLEDQAIELVVTEARISERKTNTDDFYLTQNGYLPDPFVVIEADWVLKNTYDRDRIETGVAYDNLHPVWNKAVQLVSVSNLLTMPITVTVLDWDNWNPGYLNDPLGTCIIQPEVDDLAAGQLSVTCGQEGDVQDFGLAFRLP